MIIKNSFEEYAAMSGVNSSFLKDMEVPAVAIYNKENPKQENSLTLGTVLHAMCEDYMLFTDTFAWGEYSLNSNKGVEAYHQIIDDNPEKIIIKQSVYEQAREMYKSLISVPRIKKILENIPPSKKELSLTWTEQGVECKGRLDTLCDDLLLDIKTTKNIHNFSRELTNYYYPLQITHYIAGARANDISPTYVKWVVVSNQKPYMAAIFEPSEATLRAGEAHRQKMLARYKECLKNEEWPGIPAVQTVDAQRWYLEKHLT